MDNMAVLTAKWRKILSVAYMVCAFVAVVISKILA